MNALTEIESVALVSGEVGELDVTREFRRGRFWTADIEDGWKLSVQVLSGTVWATFEGDINDYVLGLGEALTFHGPGRLVIEALESCEIKLRTTEDAPKALAA